MSVGTRDVSRRDPRPERARFRFLGWDGPCDASAEAPRCNGGDLPVPIGSHAVSPSPIRRLVFLGTWHIRTVVSCHGASRGGFSTFQGPLALSVSKGGVVVVVTCCPARVSGGETRLGDDCRVPPCKSARQANIAYHDSLQPICDADASKRPHSLGLGPRKPMCPL